MFHILIFIEVLVFSVLLFLRGLSSQLNPLFYASATALPCSLLFLNLSQTSTFRNPLELPMWPSSLIISMGLLLLFYHLFSGKKLLGSRWSVLAMISVVLLGVFTTPGVLVAIGLLVAGYAFYDRILSYLSYLFIPAFLVTFYYTLNVDLACKSYVVTGSGVLLLLTRWLLCCWSRKVEA